MKDGTQKFSLERETYVAISLVYIVMAQPKMIVPYVILIHGIERKIKKLVSVNVKMDSSKKTNSLFVRNVLLNVKPVTKTKNVQNVMLVKTISKKNQNVYVQKRQLKLNKGVKIAIIHVLSVLE